MKEHEHIMYASPSHIDQLFYDRYGSISEIEISASETAASSVKARLGALVTWLQGSFSGEIGREEIHKMNYDEETIKIKKVVQHLLQDDEIPSINRLEGAEEDPTQMYRFSSEVLLKPVESDFDDSQYIEVAGIEGDVKFRGKTSLDNWGSRSDLLTAMDAKDTYPFQGIVKPVSRENKGIEREEWAVNYLFICSPSVEERKRWYNRQSLVGELYEDQAL